MSYKRSFAYQFEYIIVGETNIGKTCLLLQFTTKRFSAQYELTVGVDHGTAVINIDQSTRLKLQIWDTSGQDAFQSITRSYYRSAIIALLVYDITSKQSFDRLDYWMAKLRDDAQDDLVVILIGNKCDLEHKREVATHRGKRYASTNGLLAFIETSAKTAHNVDEAFIRPSKYLLHQIQSKMIDVNKGTHHGITVGSDTRSQFVSVTEQLDTDTSTGCKCNLF
eukprot:102004_1